MTLVRRYVKPDEWKPVGIADLEPNAWIVVRSTDNRSVIAGPGSGKTELLAQRASYLLQCGMSPPPQRILAISFKRDAAYNLANRVKSRCHPDHAHRFDSLTFDAFSKGLVDRFGQALPPVWRPTPNYQIAHITNPIVLDFLQRLVPPAGVGTKAQVMGIASRTFEKELVVADALHESPPEPASIRNWVGLQFWHEWLHGGARSALTFPMIGRLAELIVRSNPMVRQALQLTYSHLFMDEFQDTTQIQYDIAKAIFLGSPTVVTAVGDNKQQIMRWAMAMDDPFAAFEKDFKATRTPLLNNYRSSPELVRIQDILARALDGSANTPVSKADSTVTGNCCEVWDFQSPQSEAVGLAKYVAAEMAKYKLCPRDFSLLVRVRAADYMKELEPAFAACGLQLRNEAAAVGEVALQELLAEDVSATLVTLLRLVTSDRAGRHWTDCLETVCYIRGLALDDEVGRAKISKSLDEFSESFRKTYPAPIAGVAAAEAVVKAIIDFIGRSNFMSASPAYRQGDWFGKLVEAATLHLESSCRAAPTWGRALDVYEGLDSIPLMTIHKSKGLEYHTVIFVGLDDDAWFAFRRQTQEETSGFFVAFTRAKQRVVFSYTASRGTRAAIAPLYDLLSKAGVRTIAK